MTSTLYFLLVVVVCVVVFAKMALVIIPQSETKIIERHLNINQFRTYLSSWKKSFCTQNLLMFWDEINLIYNL